MLKDRLASAFYRLLPYELNRAVYSALKPAAFERLRRYRREVLTPFDNRQCIFIHIPKTGGISVANAIFGKGVGWHLTLRPYQKMYNKGEFRRYFKFAFVRNPWDRLLSAYLYLKRGGLEPCDELWARQNLAGTSSFDQFVKEWVTTRNIHTEIHFYPQYKFISIAHNNHIDVDYVGRYENLGADFGYVCARLGIKASLGRSNVSKNREKRDYREYYSPESRAIVERVYRKDIQLLGYTY